MCRVIPPAFRVEIYAEIGYIILYENRKVRGIGMERQLDKISLTDNKTLIRQALAAREKAYAPYSGYKVGAALLTKEGVIYTGCNIENAGYTATNCAERTAFFKAVSEGEKDFECIAIVGGYENISDLCPPCGVCLQVMMEFCNPEKFKVILAKSEKEYEVVSLKELLPRGFGPSSLA